MIESKMYETYQGGGFVRGYHHNLTFENGYREYGWSATKIKRSEAIRALLNFANCGDFKSDWVDGKQVFAYDKEVIETYWVTKSDTR